MGADITESNFRDEAEPMCDLTVKYSKLHGVDIGGAIIPRLIDELPVIAVAAAFAEGETVIRDAQELKVKESNRIAAMVAELTKAGVDVEETDDGMIVHGGAKPHGASFETYKDHRIAMSLAVLGLAAEGASRIDEPEVVAISYPDFFNTLERLGTESCCFPWTNFALSEPKKTTYALFGWPLGHTMSPELHAQLFEASGQDADYIGVAVPPEDLPEAFELAKRKLGGINCTIPHKKGCHPLLDEIDTAARDLHSVNTVRFADGKATGFNTDILGFAESLNRDGVSLQDKKGTAARLWRRGFRDGIPLRDAGRVSDHHGTQSREG